MSAEVVFYRLARKVVHNRDAVPEDARQVLYYPLMIGHHVGVMDCFVELMAIPAEEYARLLDVIDDPAARRKLGGALEWGEIEINCTHVRSLEPALQAALSRMNGSSMEWVSAFVRCLHELAAEPAYYLMLKRRP